MPGVDNFKELKRCVNENRLEIEKIKNQDWYSNKELYEMFCDMREDLQQFNKNFAKYNGLIGKVTKVQADIAKLKSERKISIRVKESLKENINWIMTLVAFVLGSLLNLQRIIEFFS